MKFGSMLFASILTWTATLGVCFLTKHTLDLSDLFDLVIGLVVIGLGALVHVRTPALSESDRQILANVLRGKESRLLEIIGIIRPIRITE